MKTKSESRDYIKMNCGGNSGENIRQLCARHVKIARGSRQKLRKMKNTMWGNVLNAIECPEWMIPNPEGITDYGKMCDMLVAAFHEFYDIPSDIEIKIRNFDTDIMSFESGIYPEV